MSKSSARGFSNTLSSEATSVSILIACIGGFLFYNWGNTLTTVIALSRSVLAFFSSHDPYSVIGKDAYFRSMGQSLGLAAYFTLACILLKAVTDRLCALLGEARKRAISQEKYNRLKRKYLSREALTLDQIETLQIERKKDRKLITELRDVIVSTKLELESLQIGKTSKKRPNRTPSPSNDLFSVSSSPRRKPKTKRFVPNLLWPRKPPEF